MITIIILWQKYATIQKLRITYANFIRNYLSKTVPCSRTVYCVLEHSSVMLERNISAQFYCSVLNGVFSEHCSYHPKRK